MQEIIFNFKEYYQNLIIINIYYQNAYKKSVKDIDNWIYNNLTNSKNNNLIN